MSRHKPDIQVADPERAPGRIKSIVISIILSALCIPAFGMMAPPVFLGDRPERYDIIIENGRIIDGTGNPWYYGDIGILGDRIVSAGKVLKKQR